MSETEPIREPQPIKITASGEVAAFLRAEAELQQLTPLTILNDALILYQYIVPELRNGGRLILEQSISDNRPRGFLGRTALKLGLVEDTEKSEIVFSTLKALQSPDWLSPTEESE